jgi:hypothetical protein
MQAMPSSRLESLAARLEKGRSKTRQALETLAPEQWSQIVYREPPDWSVRDLLAHFVSAEVNLLELCQDVAAGGAGAPLGFDFDAYNAQEQDRLRGRSSEELLQTLHEARARTLAWVRALDDAVLDRMGTQPGLGEVPLETMITAMYGHQLLHIRELQQKLANTK